MATTDIEVLRALAAAGPGRGPDAALVLARVVALDGSAPVHPGATLLYGPEGRLTGSVGGDCIDVSVLDACVRTLQDQRPRLVALGPDVDGVPGTGVTCGGVVKVLVQALVAEELDRWRRGAAAVLERRECCLVVTALDGPCLGRSALTSLSADGRPGGCDDLGDLTPVVAHGDASALRAGRALVARSVAGGRILVHPLTPRPQLVVVGAGHVAQLLSAMAATAGFDVVVCDHRPELVARSRFPPDVEVVLERPPDYLRSTPRALGADDAVCVLTHDALVDTPTLAEALRRGVGYVGAMGSAATTARRRAELAAAGWDAAVVDRIAMPIGLLRGTKDPADIAVSILAELVAACRLREVAPTP